MTIYRGPGGGGNADSDAEINALTTLTNQALAYSEAAGLEADAAALSAAAASTSAASAATSASGAATSATNAASSASSASISASSASTSATNAASSASSASTSATNAASSASAASTSATNAATSETNAAASEASALTYSTASAASAVTASTQAGLAATSATAAAGSATTASTQASNAATSASSASTSATNAASSASAASVSAAAALASEVAAAASVASIDLPTIVRNNAAGAISVSSSSPALRITQLGTGNALLVEDSANPDASPFVIGAGGNVVRGHTTTINLINPNTGSANGPQIENVDTSIGGASFGSVLYVNNGGQAGYYALAKSRGTTVGDMATLQNGDNIGYLSWQGSDGTNFIRAADITAAVDSTPGTNDMPGRLVFSTTADGASSPTERMRINSAGNVGVGTTAPLVKLAINSTDAMLIPKGTTAQRPTGATGYFRYNTDLSKAELYNGTAWGSVGGGATGAGGDAVFQENDQAVTTSYTISTNKNASSVGPITVASGVSVTIPTGSRWVVI